MAMNKKERGELEEARHDADYLPKLAKALRWTDAKPEMDLPKPANGHTTGWSYFFSSGGYTGIHGGIIQKWSQCSRHGNGDGTNLEHGDPNGIALYSTKLLALKALRAEMELAYANELLKIDQQIEQELLK